MRFLYIFIIAFFFKESYSACLDKSALSSVSVLVHKEKNTRAIVFTDINFNVLDDYISVDVTRANVSQLCEGMIKNFARLETLTLINLGLSLIEPGSFQNVPKLKSLSLAVNQITTIPREVFNTIPSLRVIYLTRNQIQTIEDGAFSQMPNLKAVHLDHNNIALLSGNIFFGSPKLSLIDFSFNNLKKIPKNAFDDLRPEDSIRVLNIHLNMNEISEIHSEALKELIPVNLHVGSNQLTRISDVVFSVQEGSTLYFPNNKVVSFADDVIERINGKNIVVNLKSNPVDCECIKRVESMLTGEAKGQLNIETTLFCHPLPVFENTY